MSICCTIVVVFFFFKQKTAYEMRISDWSSDVCSSDLARRAATPVPPLFRRVRVRLRLAAVTQLVDPEGVVLLGPVEVDLTAAHGIEGPFHPDSPDVAVADDDRDEDERDDSLPDLRELHPHNRPEVFRHPPTEQVKPREGIPNK